MSGLFHPERRTAHYNATGTRMVKSLEKSLRFLQTDRVELQLVHRPDWLTSADDTAAGLNQLLRDGKIRSAPICAVIWLKSLPTHGSTVCNWLKPQKLTTQSASAPATNAPDQRCALSTSAATSGKRR